MRTPTFIFVLLLLLHVPALAQKDLKMSEIYYYNVGDEFHTSYLKTSVYSGNYFPEYFKTRVVYKFYNSATKLLQYKYAIEHTFIKWLQNPTRPIYVSENYTLDATIQLMDSLATDIYHQDTMHGMTYFDSAYYDSTYNHRLVNRIYYNTNFEGGFDYIFIEGCGGWYGEEASYPDITYRKLHYYKKGSEEWGYRVHVNVEEMPDLEQEARLYPNPSKGRLILSLPFFFKGTLKAFDFLGNEVFAKNVIDVSDLEFNLPESLEKGYYFIEFTNDDVKFTRKILLE